MTDSIPRPLEGVRVVEIATWAMVPMAGTLLAEWGADVIKIEHPESADPLRGLVMAGHAPDVGGVSYMWELHNRGKRAVALDLASPGGQDVITKLIATADVFLTNLLPRSRAALHLEASDVHAANPRAIYAVGGGMGPRGPEANRGGYDTAAFWARSGIAYKSTDPQASFPPDLPSAAIGDDTTGYMLAGAIAAALAGQAKNPRQGVALESSLLAAGLWAMRNEITACELLEIDSFFATGRGSITNPINATFETADGRFIQLVMLEAERHWPDLCRRVGREDLIEHSLFATMALRAENVKACLAELEAIFCSQPLEYWKRVLAEATGVWAVVQSPREAAADPQARINGYVGEGRDGAGRPFTIVANPVQFNGQTMDAGPAPGWGEHTDQILEELGIDEDGRLDLRIRGAIL